MSALDGSTVGKAESGTPMLAVNHRIDAPVHENRPSIVKTGQPVIEITCSKCGELTARTYPIEVNGEMVATAPDEKYSCSCPTPS